MMTEIDWDSVKGESVDYLRKLIRINTTNPPGNETEAAKFLQNIFNKEGFKSKLIESAPDRGNLITRIKGESSEKPLLLLSHLDVVSADESEWTYPPFEAKLENGYIWGRGAVDMKQMTIMELMVLLLLKRNKIKPKRDIIFAAVADEELGGNWGTGWLVDKYPELIKAEWALNEVGGASIYLKDTCYYPINIAEKGRCWTKIRVKGDSGHGSIPHDNNAIVKIAAAVSKLGKKNLPQHNTSVMVKFINILADNQKLPLSLALKQLLNPTLSNIILKNFFPDKSLANVFYANLHNTVNPTILRGGASVNVVPSEAEFELDGRILPGQTNESFIREIKDIIGNQFEFEVTSSNLPLLMDSNTELYKKIETVIKHHHPGSVPVPTLLPGYTDAVHLNRLGIKCYGFVPMKLKPGEMFSKLFHGHNERISVDSLLFGVKVLFDIIKDF